jgi:hypothetical protein
LTYGPSCFMPSIVSMLAFSACNLSWSIPTQFFLYFPTKIAKDSNWE